MRKYLLLMLLACAAISGCSKTTSGNACDGWNKLQMTLPTALHITMNDRPFANQVASHNLHGSKQGCW